MINGKKVTKSEKSDLVGTLLIRNVIAKFLKTFIDFFLNISSKILAGDAKDFRSEGKVLKFNICIFICFLIVSLFSKSPLRFHTLCSFS